MYKYVYISKINDSIVIFLIFQYKNKFTFYYYYFYYY